MFLSILMRRYETAYLCFLSLSYALYLKRIRDKVIMLRFSVRREPFAVMGLPNVFLLQWGLYAVEPQWTELLVRKKENASFELPAAWIIYLVEIVLFVSHRQQRVVLLVSPAITDRLENCRLGRNSKLKNGLPFQIYELDLDMNWQHLLGFWIGISVGMTRRRIFEGMKHYRNQNIFDHYICI